MEFIYEILSEVPLQTKILEPLLLNIQRTAIDIFIILFNVHCLKLKLIIFVK